MVRRELNTSVLSFLDKLIDEDLHDYDQCSEKPIDRVKKNISRDLENLLNSRVSKYSSRYFLFSNCSSHQKNCRFPELEQSILNYGLPDFTYISFNSDENQQQLASAIRLILLSYEPRFRDVSVRVEAVDDRKERVLYLTITAVLVIDPDPLSLTFDSRIFCNEHGIYFQDLVYG